MSRHRLTIEETLQRELDAIMAGYGVQPAPRVRHRHNFDPITRVCRDCTVTEIEHHNVPYGVGIPCNLAKRVT